MTVNDLSGFQTAEDSRSRSVVKPRASTISCRVMGSSMDPLSGRCRSERQALFRGWAADHGQTISNIARAAGQHAKKGGCEAQSSYYIATRFHSTGYHLHSPGGRETIAPA